MSRAMTVTRPPAARRAPARKAAPPAIRLPVSPRRLRAGLLWTIAALAAALAIIVALFIRLPEIAARNVLEQTAAAGFEIRDIEVAGLRHLRRDAVLDAAFAGQSSSAILAADLPAMRARVEALPWVQSATVARRLPARIEITVVERTPAALWQMNRKLTLVDATGEPLTPANLRAFAKLPLVIGEGANREMPSLVALLKTAPSLARPMDSASWVGGRRWDLNMKSGETLMLPEGYAAAERALTQFASLDTDKPLLAQGYLRFDLRLPGKMVVRVAGQPADPTTKGTAI